MLCRAFSNVVSAAQDVTQPKLGRSRHRTSSRRERALFDLFPQWAGYRFQHPPLACAGHRYSTQATQWYPSDRCPREKTTRLKGRLPRAQPRWLAGIWDLWPRCQHLPSGFRCLQIAPANRRAICECRGVSDPRWLLWYRVWSLFWQWILATTRYHYLWPVDYAYSRSSMVVECVCMNERAPSNTTI